MGAFIGILVLAASAYVLYPRRISTHPVEVQLTETQLRDQSDAIIRAKLLKSHAILMSPTDDSSVMTAWKLDVQKVYKGDIGKTATVAIPGGTFGGIQVVYEDAPEMKAGDSMIMYLRWLPEQKKWVIMSYLFGLRHIEQGMVTDALDVKQDLATFEQSF